MKGLTLGACVLFILVWYGFSGFEAAVEVGETKVVIVAQDGSGDFSSVEAAVEYLKSSTLPRSEKVVIVKPGRYSIIGGLVLPDFFTIKGEGSPALVRNGTILRMITNEKGVVRKRTEVRNRKITIKDLTLDGNKLGLDDRKLIWFLNVDEVLIENCALINSKGDALVVTWASNVRIKRCTFRGNGGSVYFDRTDDSSLEDSRVEEPYGNRSCVDIYYARRISVLNNQLLRASRKGINMECVQDSLIKGNTIAFAKRSGISIYSTGVDEYHPDSQASTGNRIISNRIYNNGVDSPLDRSGVHINHATRFTVYSTHNLIEGNEIFDDRPLGQKTQLYGVYIQYPQDDHNTIRNNYIYGNKLGAIYNAAPNTLIVGNTYEPPRRVCLIASVVYGSELASEVQFLRELRDGAVMSTFAGAQFMRVFNKFYYSFSPKVAESAAGSLILKSTVLVLIHPLVISLRVGASIWQLWPEASQLMAVIAGIAVSSLIGVVYVSPVVILFRAVHRLLGSGTLPKRLHT